MNSPGSKDGIYSSQVTGHTASTLSENWVCMFAHPILYSNIIVISTVNHCSLVW